MFKKSKSKSTAKKSDSRFINTPIFSNASVDEQMEIKLFQDEALKGQLRSQGFDLEDAEKIVNMSTAASNFNTYNLYERAFILEDPNQKISLINIQNILSYSIQSCTLTNENLTMIEIAVKTCPPGYNAAFYGINKFRDPNNVELFKTYQCGVLLCKLIETILNGKISFSSHEDYVSVIERLCGIFYYTLKLTNYDESLWQSQKYNKDVIEGILEHYEVLQLFSAVLKEPTQLISWKCREIICKLMVIIVSYQYKNMSGLEILYKRIGDYNLSFFLNQFFDFIHPYFLTMYDEKIESFKKEHNIDSIRQDVEGNFKKKAKRQIDEVYDGDVEMGETQNQKKKKNFIFKASHPQFVGTVASKMSKLAKTVRDASIRSVRRPNVERNFNDNISTFRPTSNNDATNFENEKANWTPFQTFFVLFIDLVNFPQVYAGFFKAAKGI
eukprot:NODE_386_length_8322_cov_0.935547.p3 type:complete len:441 gc:universal NODE_386_length_8322_cov_0.935547:4185-5507(+)